MSSAKWRLFLIDLNEILVATLVVSDDMGNLLCWIYVDLNGLCHTNQNCWMRSKPLKYIISCPLLASADTESYSHLASQYHAINKREYRIYPIAKQCESYVVTF